jgi:sensor histidine kinase YesM
MKSKVVTIIIHVAAWLVFFSLPLIFRPRHEMGPDILPHDMFIPYFKLAFFNLFLVFMFYSNAYFFVPRLVFRKKYFQYIIIILAFFTIFMVVPDLIFRPPFDSGPRRMHPPDEFINFRQLNSVFLFMVIILISAGMRVVQEWKQAEKRNKQIEAERLETQLSFLRSQINPHFLFNTLNSIYSLALIKSDMTAEAVMKLSEMMRYVIHDVHKDKVDLQMEIRYIQHFVELHKIRLSNNVNVALNIRGDFSAYKIPPLILLPFIENAFKYGISSHEKASIIIGISVDHDILTFRISNQVFPGREDEESRGIGIHNTEERLNLMYPGKFKLVLTNNEKVFIIHLTIQLS